MDLLLSPFIQISAFLRNLIRIVPEIPVAVAFGFYMDGFRGARNLLKRLIRGQGERRSDGLAQLPLFSIRGVFLPAFPWFDKESYESALDSIADFPLRDDDVIVISYQKCGHHFIHEVLHMLLSGEARLNPKTKIENFLEVFPRPSEYFSKMKSPRVILTHLPYNFLPKRIFAGNCRIIRLSRNPKDMLVSYYNHCSSMKIYFYDDTLENFLKMNLSSPCEVEYGSYFEYELEYHRQLRGNDHVIHITFEQLKKQPAETMKKLGGFLGLDHGEEFYRKVADASSFDRVKASKDSAYKTMVKPGRSIYRRGVVGDWRRSLTVAMNDAIDAKIEAEWAGTPLIDFYDYGE